jgi:hypothetical protein
VSFKIRPDRSSSLFRSGLMQTYRLPAELFLRPPVTDKQ